MLVGTKVLAKEVRDVIRAKDAVIAQHIQELQRRFGAAVKARDDKVYMQMLAARIARLIAASVLLKHANIELEFMIEKE